MDGRFDTETAMEEIRTLIMNRQSVYDELTFIAPYHNKMIAKCIERDRLVIFGAGVYGGMIVEDLHMHGCNSICCICDNKQAGKKMHGYEILTPEDAFTKYPGATFVLTPRWYENELLQQLTGIGVDISNILIISMLETGLDII